MAASIRQVAIWDPAPSQFGAFTVGTLSGNVADSSAQGSYALFAQDTLPGSALVTFAMTANDGANLVTNACDIVNGQHTIVDSVLNLFGASNIHTRTFIKPNAGVLKTQSWVGTGHMTSAGPSFVIDSTTSGHINVGDVVQGAGVPNKVVIQSLFGGVADQPGATYITPAPAGSVNIATQAMSTANPILVRYNNSGDYEAMLCFEVTGVTANPLVGHAAQALNTVNGADTATSGTFACGSSPVLMLGIAVNGNDASNPWVPSVGTGFANYTTAWMFNLAQPSLAYEYNTFANPGTKAATFTPHGADDFTVHMLALQASSSVAFNGIVRWIPFDMACRLHSLQQGTLNVGNARQNIANLRTLALAQIASPSSPPWAKLSTAVNMPKKILICPPLVSGYVRPVNY